MPFCSAEPGGKEILGAIPSDGKAHRPASEADYVHIVVFYALAC